MCIDYKRTEKTLQKSEMQKFYEEIPSFIEYPSIFLHNLALTFKYELEYVRELKQLVGLLEMDNLALEIAQRDGVHPITGTEYDFELDKRYSLLRNRNLKMIDYVNSMVKVLETKPEKSTFKSRYEDPNDELFVG